MVLDGGYWLDCSSKPRCYALTRTIIVHRLLIWLILSLFSFPSQGTISCLVSCDNVCQVRSYKPREIEPLNKRKRLCLSTDLSINQSINTSINPSIHPNNTSSVDRWLQYAKFGDKSGINVFFVSPVFIKFSFQNVDPFRWEVRKPMTKPRDV